jgi:hypothetical protein
MINRTGIGNFIIFPLDFGDAEGETKAVEELKIYFSGECFERTGDAG